MQLTAGMAYPWCLAWFSTSMKSLPVTTPFFSVCGQRGAGGIAGAQMRVTKKKVGMWVSQCISDPGGRGGGWKGRRGGGEGRGGMVTRVWDSARSASIPSHLQMRTEQQGNWNSEERKETQTLLLTAKGPQGKDESGPRSNGCQPGYLRQVPKSFRPADRPVRKIAAEVDRSRGGARHLALSTPPPPQTTNVHFPRKFNNPRTAFQTPHPPRH